MSEIVPPHMNEIVPPEQISLPESAFRPGSFTNPRGVNFYVSRYNGLGDVICYLPALLWIARTQAQVRGNLYVPEPYLPVVKHFFKDVGHWSLFEERELTPELRGSRPTYETKLWPNNAGANLVDIGFQFFTNLNPPPENADFYPIFEKRYLPPSPVIIPKPYAVIPIYSTVPVRSMLPKLLGGLVTELRNRRITPVFLGSTSLQSKNFYSPNASLEGGLDLTNKTSLLQAARILSEASVVIGMDGGLMHLAACSDVPLVFGYNVASVEHRRPKRRVGPIADIYPDPEVLPCTFCQSKMRFLFHDFRSCVYKDSLCLELLSEVGPWMEAVDKAIRTEYV